MPSLRFGEKVYRFYNENLVNPIYNEYVKNNYDVKKMTITNGSDKNCAILVRGNYSGNEFKPYATLMNKDSTGAKIGGKTKPQFLLSKGSKKYGFIVLNQVVNINYKYQVIERWGDSVSSGERPFNKTTSLLFTTWESRFPLENDYLCSFGKNTFSLKAGNSSGTCGDVTTSGYSEDEPANGINCMILIKISDSNVITCNDVGYDNWETSVPENIRDSSAIISVAEVEYKEWSGLWWFGHRARAMAVNYLNANTKTWETVSVTKENSYGYGNGWAFQWPAWPNWSELRVSFSVPGEKLAVDETKKLSKTYIYRAVRGKYGSGHASHEWRSYTYSTEYGSSEKENTAKFIFSYDG